MRHLEIRKMTRYLMILRNYCSSRCNNGIIRWSDVMCGISFNIICKGQKYMGMWMKLNSHALIIVEVGWWVHRGSLYSYLSAWIWNFLFDIFLKTPLVSLSVWNFLKMYIFFNNLPHTKLQGTDEDDWTKAEFGFCCLPHPTQSHPPLKQPAHWSQACPMMILSQGPQ